MASRKEISEVTTLLLETWAKAEPDSNITKYPTAYVATFHDMAKAVLKHIEEKTEEESELPSS